MRCKDCNKFLIFSKKCKKCKDKSIILWRKNYTFTYLEKVRVKDSFYKNPEGSVIEEICYGWATFYKVKLSNGKKETYYRGLLEKINNKEA